MRLFKFARAIRPYVQTELQLAREAEARHQSAVAFRHLERAHVLGQASTIEHVRIHWHMLVWGLRRRSLRECVGQAVRIVGAATKTAVGLVPRGNTGGSNVSPFERLPIPLELEAIIQKAQASRI